MATRVVDNDAEIGTGVHTRLLQLLQGVQHSSVRKSRIQCASVMSGLVKSKIYISSCGPFDLAVCEPVAPAAGQTGSL